MQPFDDFQNQHPDYNSTTMTVEELYVRLQNYLPPSDIQQIVSAYEFAEHVHEGQFRTDGSPYFYHCTRTCKILIDELRVHSKDVLCASLLHDVLEDASDISKEILEYNFGGYVCYIVQILTRDLDRLKDERDTVNREYVETLREATPDCLLIRLTARLDNFRCLGYSLKNNPLRYIEETATMYMPLAEKHESEAFTYLMSELKSERNKFLG